MKFKKDYVCKNCGCNRAFARPTSDNKHGVYCANCGERITYTTYNGMLEINERYRLTLKKSDKYALRNFRRYQNSIRMTCSNCGALLYNSSFPKIKGQFNLVNASYCPNCGKELI